MRGHGSTRTRLIAAFLLGLLAALAAFGVIITVRYRDGLEQRVRTDLRSGAGALRRKLEAAGPRLIHTVRGIGYRFSP